MRNWLVKNLGDAMLAYEEQQQIEALLFSACVSAGKPDDMAAYLRHESEGRLHCELKIYISPALGAVVKLEGTQACKKPSHPDLGLLVGETGSWLALFSESDGD